MRKSFLTVLKRWAACVVILASIAFLGIILWLPTRFSQEEIMPFVWTGTVVIGVLSLSISAALVYDMVRHGGYQRYVDMEVERLKKLYEEKQQRAKKRMIEKKEGL